MKHLLIGLLFLVSNFVYAQNVKTFIPERAHQHLPTLKEEAAKFAPEIDNPWYFAGLIEHESCPFLGSPKCWSTISQLKNNREHGLGLFQMTRAWDVNGNLRFDNLTALAIKYRTHLKGMSWENYGSRPDYQIRSGLLLWMEAYNAFPGVKDKIERMKFSDSSFNGGVSHVKRSREICTLTTNCNPGVWDGNVAKYLPKSKTPDSRYGGQSMYSINVKHVDDVFNNRMGKYKKFWE